MGHRQSRAWRVEKWTMIFLGASILFYGLAFLLEWIFDQSVLEYLGFITTPYCFLPGFEGFCSWIYGSTLILSIVIFVSWAIFGAIAGLIILWMAGPISNPHEDNLEIRELKRTQTPRQGFHQI